MIDTFLGDPIAEDWRIYSPVLRAKASEWQALKRLSAGVRQRIAPIVEFIPDWDAPDESPTGRKRHAPQTAADYVGRMLDSTVATTPAGTRSLVYFGLAHPNGIWSGIDLWSEFAVRVPAGTQAVPLADLSSLTSSQSLQHTARTRGELGLRIVSADINAQLESRIGSALRLSGLEPGAVHVVVDLKNSPVARSHAEVRSALGSASAFASVAVLGGVFPPDLTQYQPGVASEPRVEWSTWWREHIATATADRMLAFGDYTTQCALYQPSPGVPGSVSLRYTVDDAILVFRGRQSNNGTGLGHDQMHGHCRLLVARQDYDGAAFSYGDQRMACWTDPANGTGNAVQWRTSAVVHHITHVVAQLHDPVGSSASARSWARAQPAGSCK